MARTTGVGLLELVERACSRILAVVESRLLSIRLVIERLRPRTPRGLLNALCLGVLRNYRLLSHGLRRCGYRGPVRGNAAGWLALIGAYEALFRHQVGLERVEEATGLPREVALCLRSSKPEDLVASEKGYRRLGILYSVPDWVVEKLAEAKPPGGVEALLRAFQEPTPLWMRFNKGIISREEAVRVLGELGIRAQPDPVLDDVLEVISVRENALSRINPRVFYVQDRAAALVAHIAGSAPVAIDLFSAPGNKASHIAWRGGAAYVVGVELSIRRIRDEKRLVRRQDAWVIDLVLSDALEPPIRYGSGGVVLVDPDCTSMGRLGHSPETRLFLERAGPGIARRLAGLQERALREAARIAKRGARIVYSTCTLTLDENEHVVERVAGLEGLHVLRAEPFIGVEGLIPGTQRIYPHVSRCTGGFVALLAKE